MLTEWNVHPQHKMVQELTRVDPVLGKLISHVGQIVIPIEQDPFQSLISTIIGQQLSVKAAATIRSRVLALVGQLTPSHILDTPDEQLRSTGVSKSKILYMKDLCHKVLQQELTFDSLHQLKDEDVIRALTSVKGIGRWTAEMFLIFTLGRENILSLGDAGLQRAARWLYQVEDALVTKGKAWNPYASVASLYLWEAVDQGLVNQFHSIDEAIQSAEQETRI